MHAVALGTGGYPDLFGVHQLPDAGAFVRALIFIAANVYAAYLIWVGTHPLIVGAKISVGLMLVAIVARRIKT